MPSVKVAVVGAGSYVFGPSILHQAIVEQRLEGIHLALMDPDASALEVMAGVGARMARDVGIALTITTHTDWEAALDGADFVVCSAARQLYRRFETDHAIIDQYVPGHLVTEFGGIAGISYSLRQIALIEEIAEDMQRHCPAAWLLVSSNPLPRVSQAAHALGVKTVGFCSVSLDAYKMVWRLFGGEALAYPFEAARRRWTITTAGLNHFCWVLDARDQATGEDILPELRRRIAAGASSGNPRSEALLGETGYLLVPNDTHTRDFLPPDAASQPLRKPSHGTPEERQARFSYLRGVADGTADLAELRAHAAWERPVDLVAAMAYDRATTFHALNLVNDGRIAALPAGVFAETPAHTSPAGIAPVAVELPAPVVPYVDHAATVTDTIVQAALHRDRRLLHHAVALDPTILDKRGGVEAIDACLRAHADVLPRY